MIIVPSGTKRVVMAQQSQPANTPTPPKREGIQQENISPGGSQVVGQFIPIGQLDNTLQNQSKQPSAPNVPDKAKLDAAVEPNPGMVGKEDVAGSNEGVVDGGSIKIKQALDKLLMDLGVSQRKLIQHDKRRFQYNKRQQTGYFEIPERTGGGEQIGEDAVDKICNQLEQGFNIETEPVFQGGIWKVTFKPRVVEQQELASSWDSPEGVNQKNQAKAAYSKDALIKESKNDIVNSLIKQGFGGTK